MTAPSHRDPDQRDPSPSAPAPTRIDATFARLGAAGRKAFVSYVMAFDPDRETSLQILRGLPAGVQLFSLFGSNPQLIDLLADICGTVPGLAAYLARHPAPRAHGYPVPLRHRAHSLRDLRTG